MCLQLEAFPEDLFFKDVTSDGVVTPACNTSLVRAAVLKAILWIHMCSHSSCDSYSYNNNEKHEVCASIASFLLSC